MKLKRLMGAMITASGFFLAYHYHGWHLVFILALALWGNNLEQQNNEK